MADSQVGITFSVKNQTAGGLQSVTRDISRINRTLNTVGLATTVFLGWKLGLQSVARATREFLIDTAKQSPGAVKAMSDLNKEWLQLKGTAQAALMPVVEDFIRGLERIAGAANTARAAVADVFKEAMSSDLRRAAEEEYRQVTGDTAAFRMATQMTGGEAQTPPQFIHKWQSILANYQQQSAAQTPATSSPMALTKEQQAAREQVEKMNDALSRQVFIQAELSVGRQNAAAVMQYAMVLEEAYGDDIKTQTPLLEDYKRGLEDIDKIKRNMAVKEYLDGLRQENEYLQQLAAGNEKQADWLKTVNDLKKQGITDLTPQEIDQIKELQAAHENLTKQIEQRSKVQEQAIRMVKQAADGLGDSIAGAVVYSENLGDNLKALARQLAFQYLSQTISSGGQQAGAAAVQWVASKFHEGGTVGRTAAPQVSLPASVWANAPRLHQGLNPDEYPAILQRDEKVVPAGQSLSPSVVVHNHGTAKSARAEYDPRSATVAVFLDDMDHNGPISRRMRMG